MSLIDTYQIATCGQNLTNTFTLASNGILIDIFIEELAPITVPSEGGGGIIPGQEWPKEEKKKVTRKRITVIANVGGIDYKETIVVEDEPNLTVDNVSVDVQPTDTKPIITISIKK